MIHRGFHHLQHMIGIRVRGARHKSGAGRDGLFHRVDRMIHRAPHVGLAFEAKRRRGRGLLLGQAINPVIHDHIGHLDVLAGGVIEVIAADGKRVAIPAEHEHMQIRAAKRNAAGKRQRAAMNIMRAVGLDEIRKPARAANARDGRDLLVPELALFDQLEIKREHGEIAAARAPRRVIGGDFFFGQTFAFVGSRIGMTRR